VVGGTTVGGAGAALVRAVVGMAEGGVGLCPGETAGGGDPAQAAMANSARIVAARGRIRTAPASPVLRECAQSLGARPAWKGGAYCHRVCGQCGITEQLVRVLSGKGAILREI
jgi:hypothetical protein